MTSMPTPSRPFSNGTEEHAWMSVWCSYCAHDHAMHDTSTEDHADDMCDILLHYMAGCDADGNEWRWPEAWMPEAPGIFGLPSRMTCGQFRPCTKDSCTGDPAPDERAERVLQLQTAWQSWKDGDQ